MFRIAHLTDPHVGPLPRAKVRELFSKRIAGWFNWHRNRRMAHDMELLAISWIRTKYMDTPFLRAAYQVVVGGVLVLVAGILIGSA